MEDFLDAAVAMAKTAGAIHLERLGKRHEIAFKGDIDLVTEVDRLAERAILDALERDFPSHRVIAEESGEKPAESENCWFIDPLDGTTNYAHGFPFFAVSLGLTVRGRAELGVVYAAALGELFTAVRGQGAFRNGERIGVSAVERVDDALLATGFPPAVRQDLTNVAEFIAFLRRGQSVRRPGSAALDLCYVASGRIDGFWEYGLAPWDVAAGSLIVEEAGGRVTGISEVPFTVDGRQILATNGFVHEEMRSVLASPPRINLDPLS